jgi:fatty-acyl-CoA synthase
MSVEELAVEGVLPAQTPAEVLRRQAEATPGAVALVVDDDPVTFGELFERASRIARGLVANGIQPGERIAVLMPNSVDHAASIFGIWLAGAAVVAVNARYRPQDLAYVLGHSEARALLTTDRVTHTDYVEVVTGAFPDFADQADARALTLDGAPALRMVVLAGDRRRHPALPLTELEQDADRVAVDELRARGAGRGEETGLVLYTSGTTAAPKGCEIRYRALVVNWTAWCELVSLGPGEAVWAPSPMFHIAGIGPLVAAVCSGGTMLTSGYFQADEAMAQIRRWRPKHLFGAFPAMTLDILRSASWVAEDLGFVRTMHSVAPPQTQEYIQSQLPPGAVVTSNFGMTEGAGAMTYTRLDDPAEVRLATTGRAFPGYEIRVCDPATDVALPAGERGEIQFRSPTAFHRYLKDPQATAATILPEGWIKTGDLGVLDDRGNLAYLGRIKEMLKVGGENVAPMEVEALLATHPAVHFAQIVGRDDDRLGEVPVAFVELVAGATVGEQELIEFVKGRVASFKVPRAVLFVTEWPMSTTKILKSRLREMAAGVQPNG